MLYELASPPLSVPFELKTAVDSKARRFPSRLSLRPGLRRLTAVFWTNCGRVSGGVFVIARMFVTAPPEKLARKISPLPWSDAASPLASTLDVKAMTPPDPESEGARL